MSWISGLGCVELGLVGELEGGVGEKSKESGREVGRKSKGGQEGGLSEWK